MFAERIFSSLNWGRVLSRRDVDDRVRPVVERMWAEGDLPAWSGGRWIVGAHVQHEHMGGTSINYVTVGPAKPSAFRQSYVRCEWRGWRSQTP